MSSWHKSCAVQVMRGGPEAKTNRKSRFPNPKALSTFARLPMAAAAAISTLFFSTRPPAAGEARRIRGSRRRVRCSVASDPAVRDPGGEAAAGRLSVDCVVVGGGISGLCTAQALATRYSGAAAEVLVTEARNRVGGNITTVERDGYLWEEGPNSFQPSDPVLCMAVLLLPIS